MKIRRSIDAFFALLLLLLTVGLLPVRPALAQTISNPAGQAGGPYLSNVVVQIWPEYDQPSALIIYNITISPQVTLPTMLSLRIPASAGKPYAVAWQSPDKALYDLKYDFSTVGDWSTVKFSAPAQDIRLEYYDPSLKKTGTQRSFTYHWPGDYRVDNLTLEIQQPANASQMTFTPDAGAGRVNSTDGQTYYTLVAGQVNAGTTFELAMSYTKPDDTLTSKQFQKAQPSQPINSGTAGRVTFDTLLPWGIGITGLLLIAGGVLWYFRGGRLTTATRGRRMRHGSARAAASTNAAAAAVDGGRRTSSSPVPPPLDDSDSAFCHQCGKKAGPEDVFCRACGTRLR